MKKKIVRSSELNGPTERQKAIAAGQGNTVKPGSMQQGPNGNFGRKKSGQK